jgi:epoxyqueuosine reductase
MAIDVTALRARAWDLGFDLCGVAPATPGADLDRLSTWVGLGYAGDLDYVTRSLEARRDPSAVLPGARTVIVTGTIYNTDQPRSIDRAAPGDARMARYAWGEDYHEVIGRRLHLLIGWLKEHAGVPFEAVAYVDTGPVQEKALAARAGLGWIGKHSCLINEQLGSWMFLSTILTTLDLPTGQLVPDRCGTCTRCLDICPTGAIVAPYVVDARRCLSYLTIESHEDVPEEWRGAVGAQVYGCDLCQDVCPWNRDAAVTDDPVWVARPIWAQASLAALWRASDAALQEGIRRSTLYRTRVWRLRRNLTLAIAASGDAEAVAALRESRDPAVDPSLAHPVVERHRTWALARLDASGPQV